MRLMRHGLVGRLPRPANGDHARGAATMLQSAVVPTAAAPNRKPCSSTANAGTMISSAEVRTSAPSAAFSGSCGRCVLMEPSALRWSRRSSRPFSSLQPTSMPAPRRGTKTRQPVSNIASSNGIIDISLPIERRPRRSIAVESTTLPMRVRQAVVPLRAAGRGRPLSSFDRSRAPMPFQLALLLIHVHIVRCTTVRLRGKRNMGYGWGTMEG